MFVSCGSWKSYRCEPIRAVEATMKLLHLELDGNAWNKFSACEACGAWRLKLRGNTFLLSHCHRESNMIIFGKSNGLEVLLHSCTLLIWALRHQDVANEFFNPFIPSAAV